MADTVKITLPDGSVKEYKRGVTGREIAESIGQRLAKAALAVKVGSDLLDLARPIEKDGSVKILTFDDADGKQAFWHSTAHILAHAVVTLWPEAKPTIGPPIENGFYYDFERKEPFTPEDLRNIEAEMQKVVRNDFKVMREEVSVSEAKKKFKHNKYKLELIDEFGGEGKTLSVYTQGDFCDLCRGGHLLSTGMVKAFALTKTSSAYWRGDAKRESLQRIYGVSFPQQKLLDEYLHMIEEAEKRDHRKIGAALDLFSFHDVSPGSPFFHPKGMFIFTTLMSFLREEYKKRGYLEVATPQLFHKELWETSGHWQHYRQNMFLSMMDDAEAGLKSMNCPSHILIYKTAVRSYRELPLRLADFSPLHRNEVKGTLGGLFRVRRFHQDDAHIFCGEEQIEAEVHNTLSFVKYIYATVFHFDFHLELSTRPENALGAEALWDRAEAALIAALEHAGMAYKVNPGDGAFYGPKIDVHMKDALGRSWQCGTIQLDFNQPERFDVHYDGADGKRHRAVMVHRAILGSLERFIGVLIEHYAGKFPLWLNPNQVILLPIADRHAEYCRKVAEKMREAGLRAEVDENAETTNKKIREAQLKQFNYILVCGDAEVKNGTVNVRTRDEKVHGEKNVDALIHELLDEIRMKK